MRVLCGSTVAACSPPPTTCATWTLADLNIGLEPSFLLYLTLLAIWDDNYDYTSLPMKGRDENRDRKSRGARGVNGAAYMAVPWVVSGITQNKLGTI